MSDCAFRDPPIALQAGDGTTQGQAEVAVRRCVFERCGIGISIQNWNSLDWYIWDSQFLECDQGVSNNPGCGAFNVYRSRFRGSKKADVRMGHLGQFSLVENLSENSACFLAYEYGPAAGANLTMQGNRIEHPRGPCWMGNSGPALLLDNVFLMKEGDDQPAIAFGANNVQRMMGNAVLIGNRTTGSRLYKAPARYEVREIGISDMGFGIGEVGGRRSVVGDHPPVS